jgi:hypothetical protein
MENKIIHKIKAQFEGHFYTQQKDVVEGTVKIIPNDSHLMHIYRGHVTDVEILNVDEKLPKTEFEFYQVHNIQIEPGGQWPHENPRIFDFYEFFLEDVKFGQPNFQKGVHSSLKNDETYVKISGTLYGSILERRINPPANTPLPNPSPDEPCIQCNADNKSGGYGVDERKIYLGPESGKVWLRFNPVQLMDRLEVTYEGKRIWSTYEVHPNVDGFVGGELSSAKQSSEMWKSFDYKFNKDNNVSVVVTGKEPGTVWDYTLYCPNHIPPNLPANAGNDPGGNDDPGVDNPKKPDPPLANVLSGCRNKGCLNWLKYLFLLLLILFLLKQCTSLGRHVACYYEKAQSERLIKEYDEEIERKKKEIDDTEIDVQPCASKKANGKNEVAIDYYELGEQSGIVSVPYEMYSAKDMMEVYYDGQLVGSTNGLVSGTGTISWNYTAKKGSPTQFMVKLIPGPDPYTEWKYDLICPQ